MTQDLAGSNEDETYGNMVKVNCGEHNFYLDGYLLANLITVKKDVKKDYDAFIVVTGREGFGKSTFAAQVATYLDPTFNLDRVVFNDEQFIDAVRKAQKYQAIVFDETMGYLGSRGSMSEFNRTLIKIFSEMRSKNLYIILCIANFFELDRYPAIHRSTGLLHIYKRSMFSSYDYNKKRDLYIKGKKYYAYNVSPTFIGRCTKYFPLPKEEYEQKKQDAINEYANKKNQLKDLRRERNDLIKACFDRNLLNIDELSEILGLSPKQIRKILDIGG